MAQALKFFIRKFLIRTDCAALRRELLGSIRLILRAFVALK
jgi:hypothetical protein